MPGGGRKRGERAELQDVPVLVVEDDPASAKLFAVVLRGEGCDVQIARSAEEALAVMRTFRPRLIVLDLILPHMSGLLLAQQLKGDPATRPIALFAVSAFNGPETERLAAEAGCAGYLRKPIDPIAFPALIRGFLDGV